MASSECNCSAFEIIYCSLTSHVFVETELDRIRYGGRRLKRLNLNFKCCGGGINTLSVYRNFGAERVEHVH